MNRFAFLSAIAAVIVASQFLSLQPAEARGRKHHMRDQYARQAAFNQYYGGAGCNMPGSGFAPTAVPPGLARQMYSNSGFGYGQSGYGYPAQYNQYGYQQGGFLRNLLGY